MSVDLYPDGIYKCEEGRWSRIGPLSSHAVLGEVLKIIEGSFAQEDYEEGDEYCHGAKVGWNDALNDIKQRILSIST